jgi:hypothetical protein
MRSLRHRSMISDARRADTLEKFVMEFGNTSWNRPIIEMAHADLMSVSGIPPRRNDNLERALGLLPEDFERLVQKRCTQLGVSDIWKSPHKSLLPLHTVEDYVRFLSLIAGEASAGRRG